MYVGDNDEESLQTDDPGGQHQRRIRLEPVCRNTGISPNILHRSYPRGIVGWEWDQVPSPSQPGYCAGSRRA